MPTINKEQIEENFRVFKDWVNGLEKNVGLNERMFSVLSGALLLASARSSGSFSTGLMAGYMLFRGATGHCPVISGLQQMEEKAAGKLEKAAAQKP